MSPWLADLIVEDGLVDHQRRENLGAILGLERELSGAQGRKG